MLGGCRMLAPLPVTALRHVLTMPAAVTCSLTQLSMWFCKAHATPLSTSDDHGNSLSRKAHGPHGSVEGRLRVNMAVLIGCQVSADWHARLRLTARIVTTSRDGTVAKHSLTVRQCGGWWRAVRWGRAAARRPQPPRDRDVLVLP